MPRAIKDGPIALPLWRLADPFGGFPNPEEVDAHGAVLADTNKRTPICWVKSQLITTKYLGTNAPSVGRVIKPPSVVIDLNAPSPSANTSFLNAFKLQADERGTIVGRPFPAKEGPVLYGVPRQDDGEMLPLDRWAGGEVCVIGEWGGFTSEPSFGSYCFTPTAGSAAQCASVGWLVGGTAAPVCTSVMDNLTCTPNAEGLANAAKMVQALDNFGRFLAIYVDYTVPVPINAPNAGFH